MKIEEIQALITLLEESKLSEFKYKDPDGSSLYLNKGATIVQASAPAPLQVAASEAERAVTDTPKKTITSPLVGTFYTSPNPDSAPFVGVGDTVKKGDTVCIVEAMKVFNHIKADKDGVVKTILAENGEGVQFGQPLIELE